MTCRNNFSAVLVSAVFLLGGLSAASAEEPQGTPPKCGAGEVVSGSDCITLPTRVVTEEPAYPEEARKKRIEAYVVLQFVVYKNGSVGEVTPLVSSNTNFEFKEAAIAAVEHWKYEPARRNKTEAVAVYITARIDFKLRNGKPNITLQPPRSAVTPPAWQASRQPAVG